MSKWIVGQWCFFEYELAEITETEGARVTTIADGYFEQSGYDLSDRCVPLTRANKRIAAEYKLASNAIHKDGGAGLNYPDIHRWLVDHWRATCDVDESSIGARYTELLAFRDTILRLARGTDTGYGFPLMRPR